MKAILTFSLLVLLTACGTKDSQQQSEPVRSTTIKDILLDQMANNAALLPYIDRVTYVKNHIDEVEKTFNINKVDTCGNFYIAYYSFSIGSDVARDATYFTKIPGDTLCITSLPYIPDIYSWSNLNDIKERELALNKVRKRYGMPNDADIDEINKKVEQWKGEDSPWWYWNALFL